jgi:leader peptidase (prepilin peptidase)/N-methyltransferase
MAEQRPVYHCRIRIAAHDMSLLTTPDRTSPAGSPIGGIVRTRALVAGSSIGVISAVTVAALNALDGPSWSWSWSWLMAVAVVVPATVAAMTDMAERRLPDRWVAATGLVALASSVILGDLVGLAAAVVTASMAALPLLLVHLAAPTTLGFGDVKFAIVLGSALGVCGSGWTQRGLLVAVMLATATGLALLWATVRNRRDVAFGPWLVVGTAVACVVAGHAEGVMPLWR